MLVTSARRRTSSRAAAALILLLAVTANVSYLGHWGSDGGGHTHIHSQAQAEEHAAHCHLGPAKCSGQQSLVGTFWVGDPPPLLSLESALRRIDLTEAGPALDPPAARLSHPPRAA